MKVHLLAPLLLAISTAPCILHAAILAEQPLFDQSHISTNSAPQIWVGPAVDTVIGFGAGTTSLSGTIKQAKVRYDVLSGVGLTTGGTQFALRECNDPAMMLSCSFILAKDAALGWDGSLLFLPDPEGGELTVDFTNATKDFSTHYTNGYELNPTRYYQLWLMMANPVYSARLFGHTLNGKLNLYYQLLGDSPIVPNQPPEISNLQQFRQFGIDEIAEGDTFVGNVAVFKANISDTDSAQVKLEVELKPVDVSFDGVNTVFSDLSTPGIVELAHDELIPKDNHYQSGGNVESFHWRARAVDAEGNASAWVEFDTDAVPSPDFTAKVVPLYSQIESEFPSNEVTLDWSEESYASGIDYDCSRNNPLNATIAGCGCAISSLVMIAKYHGLTNGVDNLPINPLNINAWLKANNGYIGDNLVSWPKAEEYLGIKIGNEPHAVLAFDRTNYKTASTAVVNSYLQQETPVIAFNARAGHYFVMDNTVNNLSGSTYTVRDPRWYRTQTLNDSQNLANEVKAYNNIFTHATIFTKLTTPTKMAAHTELYLASPAELLVTDAQGRRAGKDPITNMLYGEIPGALYFLEDKVSTSDTDLDLSATHQVKVLSLPILTDGVYTIKVIGTGAGTYTLTSSMTNGAGGTNIETFSASTSPNAVTQYDLVVTGGQPEDTTPTPPPTPTVPELFTSLKDKIQASNAKPLVKAALLVQVVAAEKLYQNGKTEDAKKILAALETEVRLLKKKNQISSAHTDTILAALAALKARL